MIKPFDFYFDFISPYSFLAHNEIIKIERKNSINKLKNIDKKFTPEFPKKNLFFKLKYKSINKTNRISTITKIFELSLNNK